MDVLLIQGWSSNANSHPKSSQLIFMDGDENNEVVKGDHYDHHRQHNETTPIIFSSFIHPRKPRRFLPYGAISEVRRRQQEASFDIMDSGRRSPFI
ncbi:unnamed protein product [Citrullus colocynthis]|uniref:Uncharacterized protein n=1 Tax=Citrullus colocynthis TaxID=252529 RepID=A0ABP0Y2L5_9ROSI